MKPHSKHILSLLLLSISTLQAFAGVAEFPFSVAADRQVLFSSGNLQYNAAQGTHTCADGSTLPGTWRFAEHQWDFVGDATSGNVYQNGIKCDNSLISESYDGWIDLFGWGTSGWNSGANAYQPWATNKTNDDYVPGGNENNNLTGDYTHADWAIYNQIGEDPAGTWRTLTGDEWLYLFHERENADKLFGFGTVNGAPGIIILPDDWITPSGITFHAGTDKGLSWQGGSYDTSSDNNYSHNTYTSQQWEEQMAVYGAVFLPATGYRYKASVYYLSTQYTGPYGSYWSSTAGDIDHAYDFNFSLSSMRPQYTALRYGGRAVRPVRDIFTAPPSAYKPLPFSVSEDQQVVFSPGNLQYNAAFGTHQCADGTTQPGTWRFAKHQYDFVGDAEKGTVYVNGENCDNAQISDTYIGWIDLFGWGTSGWNSGANAYLPWATSQTSGDYAPGNNEKNSLTGDFAYADWGQYNAIGNAPAGTWRTLTSEEWKYLFQERKNADKLFGLGIVDGISGTIILPDDWRVPPNGTFSPGTTNRNTYTLAQWAAMEAAGAVFLPASSYRRGTTVINDWDRGSVWSSTWSSSEGAHCLSFDADNIRPQTDANRRNGRSVRLVRDIPVAPPSAYKPLPFSVSEDQQVVFSPGNLQYNGALGAHFCADGTIQSGTWRFADHQWDYVGDTENGNVQENGVKCNNELICSNYDGWIDLFGWGTSGWNSGAKAYQPWTTSTIDTDYSPGGEAQNNLTGDFAYADWAVYNQIGKDPAGTWRTLTKEEWDYIFAKRPNYDQLRGQATVAGVHGYMLLPDEWEAPEGITFTGGVDIGYTVNVYNLEQWTAMEAAGAVFLSASGSRVGTVFGEGAAGNRGAYWAASGSGSKNAYRLWFRDTGAEVIAAGRNYGRPVRPVKKFVPPPPPPSAYEPKPFSVAADKQILFSSGNLQYNAAQGTHPCADGSTLPGTWRFAEHQYDYVGDATSGNVYQNDVKCNNELISESYNGWIDLFGWGTSGWNSGANAYQPWATSTNSEDYYPGSSYTNDLIGDYAYADWGQYNAVGSDPAGTWRTLTYDEWYYLINTRPNADSKYGAAKVNGMTGVVILPDDFTLPTGCGFTAGMTSVDDLTDWSYVATTNIYTAAEWQLMEAAGAVFLPCAGYRGNPTMYRSDARGYYWSSSAYDSSDAYGLYFGSNYPYWYIGYRHYGRSIRLVKDQTPPPPSAYEPMPFSVSPDRQILFSSGNLQYNAAQGTHHCADGSTLPGTWRFAEHQWDYVGDATSGTVYENGSKCNNEQISQTYAGWIDLFGWGTSG